MDDVSGLLAELRQAGQNPERALLDRVKALGPAAVRPLIEMATDEKLHYAEQDSPEVWAPLHAIQLLGELGAAEAVEPLLPLFAWDEHEWFDPLLPECFGRIGEPALPPLRALLFDRTHSIWTRSRAADGLAQIAQHYPDLRAEVVAALVRRLDPAESQQPDDETLNGLIITTLLDLKAAEAAPAILRAFAEDRVDRHIVGPESVEQEFGLPTGLPATSAGSGKGLRLALRCTACGYERDHQVEKVYYDLATMEQRRQGKETPYSELVIPQRITCPKCGAVDQYEPAPLTYIALTAELLKRQMKPRSRLPWRRGDDDDDDDGPVVYRRFTVADGREMHPYVARDMYRQQVADEPSRADLRVRYANVLSSLGYHEEATQQYQAALRIDPTNAEAYLNLAIYARDAGNRQDARRMFERVVELIPRSSLPRQKREDFLLFARGELAELEGRRLGPSRRSGRVLEPEPSRRAGASAVAELPQLTGQARKVGRNDPCPCGSGKKYKKCCGR